jgi:hypothetical protein
MGQLRHRFGEILTSGRNLLSRREAVKETVPETRGEEVYMETTVQTASPSRREVSL